MTDTVELLRTCTGDVWWSALRHQAADEIERLERLYQAEYEIVDRIWKVLGIETFEDAKGKEISEIVQDKLDEIEQLRKDVENLEGSLKNVRHAIIEDMREWNLQQIIKKGEANMDFTNIADELDAYAKEKGL